MHISSIHLSSPHPPPRLFPSTPHAEDLSPGNVHHFFLCLFHSLVQVLPKAVAESTADTPLHTFFFGQMCSQTLKGGKNNPEMHSKRCFLSRNASKRVSHQLHQAGLCVLCTITGTGSSEIQSAQTRNNIKAKKTPVNLKLRHIWKCCSYYSNQQSLPSLLSKPHAVHTFWCFSSPLTIITPQSFLLPSQKH